MKAIYLNIDPMLAEFAAWLKAGKPGDAPKWDPLPVAVTIPLGETAAIYLPDAGTATDDIGANSATIDGQTVYFCIAPDGTLPEESGDVVAFQNVPGLSALAPAAKYAVVKWDAWESENGATVPIYIGESDSATPTFFIPVLVRRETASGPVDLVDFTPPAAAPSAADIKSALVAAGDGALAGVSLGGAIINAGDEQTGYTPTIISRGPDPGNIAAEFGQPNDLSGAIGSRTES